MFAASDLVYLFSKKPREFLDKALRNFHMQARDVGCDITYRGKTYNNCRSFLTENGRGFSRYPGYGFSFRGIFYGTLGSHFIMADVISTRADGKSADVELGPGRKIKSEHLFAALIRFIDDNDLISTLVGCDIKPHPDSWIRLQFINECVLADDDLLKYFDQKYAECREIRIPLSVNIRHFAETLETKKIATGYTKESIYHTIQALKYLGVKFFGQKIKQIRCSSHKPRLHLIHLPSSAGSILVQTA